VRLCRTLTPFITISLLKLTHTILTALHIDSYHYLCKRLQVRRLRSKPGHRGYRSKDDSHSNTIRGKSTLRDDVVSCVFPELNPRYYTNVNLKSFPLNASYVSLIFQHEICTTEINFGVVGSWMTRLKAKLKLKASSKSRPLFNMVPPSPSPRAPAFTLQGE
jgi:hypothetical protein